MKTSFGLSIMKCKLLSSKKVNSAQTCYKFSYLTLLLLFSYLLLVFLDLALGRIVSIYMRQ